MYSDVGFSAFLYCSVVSVSAPWGHRQCKLLADTCLHQVLLRRGPQTNAVGTGVMLRAAAQGGSLDLGSTVRCSEAPVVGWQMLTSFCV